MQLINNIILRGRPERAEGRDKRMEIKTRDAEGQETGTEPWSWKTVSQAVLRKNR